MADGEKFVLEECKGKIEYAKDNMERVPYEFYIEKYQQADPVSISTRLGIAYNLAKQEFTLMFMGNIYYITYPDFVIRHENSATGSSIYYPLEEDIHTKILVLRYLLNASIFPHNGDFRSFRELPSGELYMRQFQGRCIFRLNHKYGNRLGKFGEIMDCLGATLVHLGDIGYELELFEELYLRFLFWKGDEEFPASSQILFSSNFPAAFDTYDLAETGEICINIFCAIERSLYHQEVKK